MPLIYEKIMVTLDGSAFAAQAMPHALALAGVHNAELILLRVVSPVTPLKDFAHDGSLLHSEEHQAHLLDEANQAMSALAQELTLQKYKVTPLAEVGLPAETIIDYAQAHNVSLIVMSTHGRTGLSRWVYGSVADKVLRAAPCPVFLIRATL
jgi:nucleotide-binding universal stress UspA family protein